MPTIIASSSERLDARRGGWWVVSEAVPSLEEDSAGGIGRHHADEGHDDRVTRQGIDRRREDRSAVEQLQGDEETDHRPGDGVRDGTSVVTHAEVLLDVEHRGDGGVVGDGERRRDSGDRQAMARSADEPADDVAERAAGFHDRSLTTERGQ